MKDTICTTGIAAALAVALVACGAGGTTDRPGEQAVYDRVESLADCGDLQSEFDTAMDNVERYEAGDDRRAAPLSYAEAADARMQELGCY